jgi:hypothetical protein
MPIISVLAGNLKTTDRVYRIIKDREVWPWIFFALVSIFIIFPFFDKGYILSLDLVITEEYPKIYSGLYGFKTPFWGGSLPYNFFIKFIEIFFPSWLVQRLILFFILFLSGSSMYRLVPVKSRLGRYFAGILYMVNPFTYVHFIVGQWMLLLSYALLPLALKSFLILCENISRKNLIKMVFSTTLVGVTSSHILVLTFVAYFVILCVKHNKNLRLIKLVATGGVLFLALNLYWLLPIFTSKASIASQISAGDLYAFMPKIASFSSFFTIASMHGFWRGGYLYAKDFLPYWEILFAFILFLVVHGFISFHRDKDLGGSVKAFGLVGVVALILGAGINSPFSSFFEYLFNNLFFMKPLRDSQRFVALLVLVYSYLGALGVAEIGRGIKNQDKRKRYISLVVVALALLMPFIYSFTFFNGFAGQIKATDYPQDWYEINDFLNEDYQKFNILFFPWHMYMDFHWIPNRDKRIANPASHFFDRPVIKGKNIEIRGIYRQITDPEQLYIDFLLKNRDNITNFGELVAPLNVKYVLLAKEADYKNYFFLFNQGDLELVKETENFYVFRNKHKVAKLYEVDGVIYIENWNELLERSRNEDITENVYLIGNGFSSPTASGKQTLSYEKKNPAHYELREKPSKTYVVFAEPYSEDWLLGDRKPLKAYGVVNAYEVDGTVGKDIKFQRFYKVNLPAYAVSLITFTALIIVYFDLHRKMPEIRRRG